MGKIKNFYNQYSEEESSKFTSDIFFHNKPGFLDLYKMELKIYPYLEQRPALLMLVEPKNRANVNGLVLFNKYGLINGISDVITNTFGISKNILSVNDKDGISVFDIFGGLSDCVEQFKKDKAKFRFLLEFNRNSMLNFIKFKNLSRSSSNQYNSSRINYSNSFVSCEDYVESGAGNSELYINLEQPFDNESELFLMQCNYVQEKDTSDIGANKFVNNNTKSNPFLTQYVDDVHKQSLFQGKPDSEQNEEETETECTELQHLISNKKNQNKEKIVKSLVGEKRTSPKLFRYYVSVIVLFCLCLGFHTIGFLHSYMFGAKLQRVNKHADVVNNMNSAVWESIFLTQKLDMLYNARGNNDDKIALHKLALVDKINEIKENLYFMIIFETEFVIPVNASLKNIKFTSIINGEAYSFYKRIGDAYSSFILSLERIVKSKRKSFTDGDEFLDFYYVMKNGINGLLVS